MKALALSNYASTTQLFIIFFPFVTHSLVSHLGSASIHYHDWLLFKTTLIGAVESVLQLLQYQSTTTCKKIGPKGTALYE